MFQTLQPILSTKLFWIASIVTAIIYLYFKFVAFTLWKKNKVPHNEPIVPFGNALPVALGRVSLGNFIKETYEKFKKHRYHGVYMFHKPFLVINDPELVRLVLIKEFNKFPDRGLYFNDKIDPLSNNLFLLPGEKWRRLRAKLSPTFTSGKLKQMFPLILEIGDELVRVTHKMTKEDCLVDIKELASRYTADTISSMAFGFNCDSLNHPESDFRKYATKSIMQNPFKNAVGLFAPKLLDIFKIPLITADVTEFFVRSFEEMYDYRHKNNMVRKDFLNLLMQLMDFGELKEEDDKPTNNSENLDKISKIEAAAQAFVFFLAGYETSSSAVTYCLYELALDLEIQQKLQKEIDTAKNNSGGLTYEKVLSEMTYLDMVFNETMRKHPSVPFLNRICVEDYQLPNSNLLVKKGTGVMISVTGLHRDPDIFPNPDKFDPERFTKENIAARSPYVYFPFGDGPRVCIGARFGIIQTKIALIMLLANYNFYVCDKTPIPVEYSKESLVQCPEGSVYLRMERRS